MRNGFSLVELSIVLVILGLLVGGILAGQSLIHAAELRSVSNNASKYMTAAHAFRDKYLGLPGDLPNATSFWGAINADPTTCVATNTYTGNATCNGDGNGMVDGTYEWSKFFWSQLSLAGMIEGKYTISGYAVAFPGLNTPGQNVGTNAAWGAGNVNYGTSNSWENFAGDYGNFLSLGGSNGNWNTGLILTPEDTWNIDKKIDDGAPGRGQLTPNYGNGNNATGVCTDAFSTCGGSSNNSRCYNANYVLTETARACRLYFRKAF